MRWPPTNIADSAEELLTRLVMLPGSHYSDPEFSWKFEIAPAGLGVPARTRARAAVRGDLFIGARHGDFSKAARSSAASSRAIAARSAVDDPRLEDRVADNLAKNEITESETLLFGRNFGVGTDIRTGPNGNLFVVSLSKGTVYEIHRIRPGK